jgi:hypothetical protein
MRQNHIFEMKLEKEKIGLWRGFLSDIFGVLYYDSGILSDF